MTTITAPAFGFTFAAPANRSPRQSFAARLAGLQARHEQSPYLAAALGAAARGALALVPFVGLAWVFVTI